MKFTLTITDATPAVLAAILSGPGFVVGATAPVVQTMPSTSSDDDESETVNSAAPAYDSDGLPWDERIHSATKAVTDGGAWRKRRGVAKDVIAAVEAELKARAMQAQPMPVMQAQPMPVMQAQPMPVMQAQPMPVMQAPMMQAAQPMPVMQPAQPMQLDFNAFMQGLAAQMGSGKIDQPYLSNLTAEIGQAFGTTLNAITDIASNPNAISYAVQILQRDGKWHA